MSTTLRLGSVLGMLALVAGAAACGGEAMPVTAAAPASGPPLAGAPAPPPPPPAMAESSVGPMDGAGPGGMHQPVTAAPRAESGGGSKAASTPQAAPEPQDRPGLGTQWGETRQSRISTVPFVRADSGTPFATAGLFYNDEEGARAMASSAGFRRTSAGSFTVANGLVSLGLRDERGVFFTGFVAGDKSYAVGESGRRYTIVVHNNTDSRLECVLSVDGLDVLDGKTASYGKRGYLVDPRGDLEVDGFRQSTDTVAAFRFGSVRGSYANQKHGDTRNVGVIGLAIFNEQGTHPVPFNQQEVDRRNNANPFPGQFATPPGS
jgi:hypothetical protein